MSGGKVAHRFIHKGIDSTLIRRKDGGGIEYEYNLYKCRRCGEKISVAGMVQRQSDNSAVVPENMRYGCTGGKNGQ